MTEIPDAYKEALHHAIKPKTSWDEQLERWNRNKRDNESKKLPIIKTSFFVPYNRDGLKR